ncbi:selenoprotein [Halobacteriales archaeon QS_8_69_26]|nr:MAG: selenoprotein [Halobacteriales archaeon QS_8_69_26]
MTDVEIEYCVPCGFLPRAQDLQEALLEEYGQELNSVALVTGDHGVFKVQANGDVVFDKEEDDYDVDDIVDSVGAHV